VREIFAMVVLGEMEPKSTSVVPNRFDQRCVTTHPPGGQRGSARAASIGGRARQIAHRIAVVRAVLATRAGPDAMFRGVRRWPAPC
jgi:hypothetical protein